MLRGLDTTSLGRWRNAGFAMVPALLSLLIGTTLFVTGDWTRAGVPTTGTHFGDLRVILLAADCAHDDLSWSLSSPPCVSGMEIYNYPSLWAKAFGAIGIGSTLASTVALVFILLFSLSLFVLMLLSLPASNRWFITIVMCLAAVAPPVLLAFERGNVDIVIFALTILSIAFLINGRSKTSGVFLGLATALKLFPLGAAAMFLPKSAKRSTTLVTYFLVSLVGVVLIVKDLPLIYARTPALDGASFGSSLLPILVLNHTGVLTSALVARAAGFAIFIAIAIVIFWQSRAGNRFLSVSSLADQIRLDHVAHVLVLAGGGAFLMAYLIGPSFDYRLITLMPAIAGFARIGSSSARIAAVVLLAGMLLSYSTFLGSVEYLGDLLLLVVAPALAVTMTRSLGRSSEPQAQQTS